MIGLYHRSGTNPVAERPGRHRLGAAARGWQHSKRPGAASSTPPARPTTASPPPGGSVGDVTTHPKVWDSPSPYVVLTPAESKDLQDQLRRWRESGYDPRSVPIAQHRTSTVRIRNPST